MAITLAATPDGGFWKQASVLAVVGIGITLLVYGGVALIVKADDLGVALAAHRSTSLLGAILRGLGRGIVIGIPILLKALPVIGTAAMIWVGGGSIIVHGLELVGINSVAHAIHVVAERTAHAWEPMARTAEWMVTAISSGMVGLAVGGQMIPVAALLALSDSSAAWAS